MIKFFRRIRQQLLSEGRFSKYLIYALGEILLVVIGILIALQINTWNESRKAHQLGQEYLKGIKSDLTNDFILLDSVLTLYANDVSLINSIDNEFERHIYRISENQERQKRIASVYESLKPSENRIHWNYAFEKKNWKYSDLKEAKHEKIFLDLLNFTEIKYFYSQYLYDLRVKMVEVIAAIDQELKL